MFAYESARVCEHACLRPLYQKGRLLTCLSHMPRSILLLFLRVCLLFLGCVYMLLLLMYIVFHIDVHEQLENNYAISTQLVPENFFVLVCSCGK